MHVGTLDRASIQSFEYLRLAGEIVIRWDWYHSPPSDGRRGPREPRGGVSCDGLGPWSSKLVNVAPMHTIYLSDQWNSSTPNSQLHTRFLLRRNFNGPPWPPPVGMMTKLCLLSIGEGGFFCRHSSRLVLPLARGKPTHVCFRRHCGFLWGW